MIGSICRNACGNSTSIFDWNSRMPDAERRLALSARQRDEAGAQDLADQRAVVEDERDHDGPEGAGRADEQDEQHHQQHRHAAEELDARRGRDPHPRDGRAAQQSDSTMPRTIAPTAATAAACSVASAPAADEAPHLADR